MGTEEFWIPAVIGALGAGGEAVNQHQAQSRENAAEVQSIQDQDKIQQKASGEASALTKQIAANTPQQIQGKLTGDYVDQLRRNAAGSTQGGSTKEGATTFGASTSALAPSAGASSRYNADTSKAQEEVNSYGDSYAGQAAAIDAAVRQRQGEALGMQTLGTNLNTLGAQSYGTNFVDQLRAQAAGQQNPWVTLGSKLLETGAASYTGSGAGQYAKYGKIPAGGKGIMADSGLTGVTGAVA